MLADAESLHDNARVWCVMFASSRRVALEFGAAPPRLPYLFRRCDRCRPYLYIWGFRCLKISSGDWEFDNERALGWCGVVVVVVSHI